MSITPEDKIIITIDGNIGSGKSTFFDSLKRNMENRSDVVFLEEPVEQWNNIRDENDVTILENYCKDQKKYAFSFQIMACVTRMKILMKALNDPKIKFIISERSLVTDKNVFAKMLYDSGNISKIDYDIYKVFYNTHAELIKNIVLVYIRTNPDVCIKRIAKRNRKGEDAITLGYLEMCNNYHEKWILNKNVNHKMIIDGNKDHQENPEQINKWITSFNNFMNFYENNFMKNTKDYLLNKKNPIKNVVYL